jgi:hypothetical protein
MARRFAQRENSQQIPTVVKAGASFTRWWAGLLLFLPDHEKSSFWRHSEDAGITPVSVRNSLLHSFLVPHRSAWWNVPRDGDLEIYDSSRGPVSTGTVSKPRRRCWFAALLLSAARLLAGCSTDSPLMNGYSLSGTFGGGSASWVTATSAAGRYDLVCTLGRVLSAPATTLRAVGPESRRRRGWWRAARLGRTGHAGMWRSGAGRRAAQ